MPKNTEAATLSPAGEGDVKLKAMCEVIASVAALGRPDRVDVLRAVANFYGIRIVMEPPQ